MMKIPEIPIRFDPETSEARAAVGFTNAGGGIGERSKIGGEPNWMQGPEECVCRRCRKQMSFYGQLDSIGDDFCIMDGGMIFLFLCWECGEVEAVMQSY